LDLVANGVPHLAGTQPWIMELVDEPLDDLLGLPKHAQQRCRQTQVLDALRSPFGLQIGAGYTPDLFCVCLKEGQEQALAETIRHPLLECVLSSVGEKPPAHIAQENENTLDKAESHDDVEGFQRVVEEVLPVIDARESGSAQELIVQNFL